MSQSSPLETFITRSCSSLADGSFVRLVLSSPITTGAPRRILGRTIHLRGERRLSLTLRYATRDVTKNLELPAAGSWLEEQLRHHFRAALLGTTERDWQLISNRRGWARLMNHRPAQTTAPTHEHDRKTHRLLDARATDWLTALGVMNAGGQVRPAMAAKYRQINRYLEIIIHLAAECGWQPGEQTTTNTAFPLDTTAATMPLRHWVDMGCGKGYLTFGLWHLWRRQWQQPVRVTGVESRPELVRNIQQLAQALPAEGLKFVAGDIAGVPLAQVDALIALHACDTATDDALGRGIESGAKLIIVAPCCHQQLRPQLGRPAPFAPVLQHGLMAERLAEWATDGLRALFLKWAGYRTKLMEFVGGEHTPKNLMLAAIRAHPPFSIANQRDQIIAFKNFLGIKHHPLDRWLNPPSCPGQA